MDSVEPVTKSSSKKKKMKKQAAAEDAKEIFDTIKSPKKLATTRDSKKGDTIKKT